MTRKTLAVDTLGVIGGMGPLATVKFLDHVQRLTAGSDQDQIPSDIKMRPVPDRTAAILSGDEDRIQNVRNQIVEMVTEFSAQQTPPKCLVMPCNTAHFWGADIQAASDIPFINMIDQVCRFLKVRRPDSPVMVLATEGTVATGLYDDFLANNGVRAEYPSPEIQEKVSTLIYEIKQGGVTDAHRTAMETIVSGYPTHTVILGCTELPLAYDADMERVLDPMVVLALEVIRELKGVDAIDQAHYPESVYADT